MKYCKKFISISLVLSLLSACDTGPFDVKPDPPKPDTTTVNPAGEDPFLERVSTTYADKVPTLLDKAGWKADTLAQGCVWYNFEAVDDVSGARQIVNVLEVDMTSGRYKLDFAYKAESDTLSAFIRTRSNAGINVLGGVNANYEAEAVYMRFNGLNVAEVSLPSNHLRFWKHEGAVLGYKDGEVKIHLSDRKDGVKAIQNYKNSSAVNIIASAPSLIEDYENIGSNFVDQKRLTEQYASLDYEDKDKHQGVRHPRTAVALTGDGDLLLITVDGRWTGQAEGMNADELTRFLIKYFNPRYALNMDGGGSTTMCVKGRGQKETNVVNYPTDNGQFNHWGQRRREAHLIIETVQ